MQQLLIKIEIWEDGAENNLHRLFFVLFITFPASLCLKNPFSSGPVMEKCSHDFNAV